MPTFLFDPGCAARRAAPLAGLRRSTASAHCLLYG
jgi:hypothetical protein